MTLLSVSRGNITGMGYQIISNIVKQQRKH